MKKTAACLFYLFTMLICFADVVSEYRDLLNDLKNYDVIGYRHMPSSGEEYSFVQGALIETGIPYTFAIMGEGYVQLVNEKNEVFYSRSCFFTLAQDGYLKTGDGLVFMPDLRVDIGKVKEISFHLDNTIHVVHTDQSEQVFPIDLFAPSKKGKITSYGSYYSFSDVVRVEKSRVYEGFLELSLVDITGCLIKMEELLFELAERKVISLEEYIFRCSLITQMQNMYSVYTISKKDISRYGYDFVDQRVVYSGFSFDEFLRYIELPEKILRSTEP